MAVAVAVAGIVAGPAAAATVPVAVVQRVLKDGVGRDLPRVTVADVEVLEARERELVAGAIQQDIGQVPSLLHHMVHLAGEAAKVEGLLEDPVTCEADVAGAD